MLVDRPRKSAHQELPEFWLGNGKIILVWNSAAEDTTSEKMLAESKYMNVEIKRHSVQGGF